MRAAIIVSLVLTVSGYSRDAVRADDGAAATADPPFYLARRLDREGKLSAALPLYAARAEQTITQANRLLYAHALLRAEQPRQARVVFDRLLSEEGSAAHGGATRADRAAVCASTALAAGFPEVAVDYARAAADETSEPARRLLLVRALAASGLRNEASTLLRTLSLQAPGWTDGLRIELARWQLLTGDPTAARRLLARTVSESVGQMLKDSVQANFLLREQDWARASALLRASERKLPPGLDDRKVDRAWRNLQRELRWVRLRRAVALWHLGDRAGAIGEAGKAQASDEEYVRSASVVLLATADLAEGRPREATSRLRILAGRNHRAADPVTALEAAQATGLGAAEASARLRRTVAAQDRSADLVTIPLFEAFDEALRASVDSRTAERSP